MRSGEFTFETFKFEGDFTRSEVAKGTLNPFTGEIAIDTVNDLRVIQVPISFRGNLSNIEVDYVSFLAAFAKENASTIINTALSILGQDEEEKPDKKKSRRDNNKQLLKNSLELLKTLKN